MAARKDSRLPERTAEVYGYIVGYKANSGGDSPSRREILEALDISSLSMVNYYLDALHAAGLIRLRDASERAARCIEVVGARWEPPGEMA